MKPNNSNLQKLMLGFGSLRQMNDTIKANRDLLRKKKRAIERQKDEIRIRPSSFENVNLDYVTARVSAKLKRNKGQELAAAFLSIAVILGVVAVVIWIAYSTDYSFRKEPVSTFFNTMTYRLPNGLVLKTDYYTEGPKAAETTMKDGMRHQNSESFYPTGEQFRSALYYYDTLVRQVYFYKNGDTIKSFPAIADTVLTHITLRNAKYNRKIEFDFIDGKIVTGTYRELPLN
ncbi:MAG TPA: hypothetical protein VF141_21190 [Chryseolinea sp.]